ncbi:MAG TPA: BatA domain-containing protein [Lacipirellulaceae bacterium]
MNITVDRFSLILAFGFGSAAMLGWLAAAAAPLLIHLWSRRRYREVPWAAVTFLLAALRKNSRRIQLQQWILLAMRTLMVVLVVLAIAEPHGQNLAAGVGDVPTHKVIVIDTSFSMAYRESDASLLTKAKQLAGELVAQSGTGDAYTVITLSDRPRQLVGRDMVDRSSIVAHIEAIPQTQGGANLAATLDAVSSALELDAKERDRWTRQDVYFFSDMQRKTWAADGAGVRLGELAKNASISAVDVGAPRATNLAVTELRSAAPFATVGEDVAFDATLHEFGDEPRKEVRVEFLVDDAPVGEQTIDVPANSDASVRFTHRFRDAGSHAVAVRAASDQLEIDNTRWLVVPVEQQIRVLCVAGEPEDAKYLAAALAPDPSTESPIRPQVISESELVDTDLTGYECMFLSNVAQLTADETERLTHYVDAGGGLAIFLGDRVQAESYNALARGEAPLLPARLTDVRTEVQFGVDPLDYRHPIAAPFRGRERAGLLTTPVGRYFRLEIPNEHSAAEKALALPNGDPLVVTAPHGRGRVVLVATAGSLSSVDRTNGEPWTTWPAWPSFLPVVREIFAFAVGGQHEQWQAMIGGPLTATLPFDRGSGDFELTRPDGRKTSLPVAVSSRDQPWHYDETDVTGIYSLGRGGALVSQFAVNVDTHESDLAQIDPHQLPAEIKVRSDWRSANGVVASGVLSEATWNRPLLWAAAALVLMELCLAWLFGRGAA